LEALTAGKARKRAIPASGEEAAREPTGKSAHKPVRKPRMITRIGGASARAALKEKRGRGKSGVGCGRRSGRTGAVRRRLAVQSAANPVFLTRCPALYPFALLTCPAKTAKNRWPSARSERSGNTLAGNRHPIPTRFKPARSLSSGTCL